MASDAGIPASLLLDIKKGNSKLYDQGSWIHPDLVGQLAQWISPIFALQVSKWLRQIYINGNIDIKSLKNKDNEIKSKDKRINMLENICLKKHKRITYPGKFVIYILTTEYHKKNGIYIIGKATSLKCRLGPYNKTSEHIVIYYKECKNKSLMKTIETMVLEKLDKYREKANRDRFILPLENEISLFTNIIDQCVNFFN